MGKERASIWASLSLGKQRKVEEKMRFEWDEEKNHSNMQKHGISFETALHVFDDPEHIVLYDEDNSVDESRFIAIGEVDKVLYVVFTERGEKTRLISARLANSMERRDYYEQNGYL